MVRQITVYDMQNDVLADIFYWSLVFQPVFQEKGIGSFVMDSLFKDVYIANNLGRQSFFSL